LFVIISAFVCLIICLFVFYQQFTYKKTETVSVAIPHSPISSPPENELLEEIEEEIIVVTLNEEAIKDNSIAQVVGTEETSQQLPAIQVVSKYYIKVNRSANTITIYERDNNGFYSNPVKAFACSTGSATPSSGSYPLTSYKAEWVPLFGGVYGQYGWQVTGHIMLHSVPYTKKYDKSSLTYYNYDKLGTSASAGCIRLTVADAKWIFENCIEGTIVEFYSDYSNPGPLGKPETKKISSNYSLRGWDPTDPDENNPWNHTR